MRMLVIGAGMVGWAAAYDMARAARVESITIADCNEQTVNEAVARIGQWTRTGKVRSITLDAADMTAARGARLRHDGVLSTVPSFLNLDLAKAAIESKYHFVDVGGNNTVVKQELALHDDAADAGVAIFADCGLSPGLVSIVGGELLRRVGGNSDTLRTYVGALPQNPPPPLDYQLVLSVEGLSNQYCGPAGILHEGKMSTIGPLTQVETFTMDGFPELEAFHASGCTSTLSETFQGQVGECFEKILRYPGRLAKLRALYDFDLFASEKRSLKGVQVARRQVMSRPFQDKFAGDQPDVTILRVEAELHNVVASFSMVDYTDSVTKMTSRVRATAWPASNVLQMLIAGEISKRGVIRQELDIPAQLFLNEMAVRGVGIGYRIETKQELCHEVMADVQVS